MNPSSRGVVFKLLHQGVGPVPLTSSGQVEGLKEKFAAHSVRRGTAGFDFDS